MILESFTTFLDEFFEKLNKLGIDISKYKLDHIGYQTSSDTDYDKLKTELFPIAQLVYEAILGGRRVGIFKLNLPFKYKNYFIPAIELIAPKEGQEYPSAPEHAEFVIDEEFDTFMEKYPSIDWNTKNIDRPVFPMIKLKLDDHMQVKFHYEPVLEIAKKINGK